MTYIRLAWHILLHYRGEYILKMLLRSVDTEKSPELPFKEVQVVEISRALHYGVHHNHIVVEPASFCRERNARFSFSVSCLAQERACVCRPSKRCFPSSRVLAPCPPLLQPMPLFYLLTLKLVHSNGTSLLLAYQSGNGLVEIVSPAYK